MTAKSRNAFTLVELLVVIGIIAVLVGILLPALASARKQANTVKCESNLRTIGQLIANYVSTSNGWEPPSFFYSGQYYNNPPAGDPSDNAHAIQYGGVVHWSYLISGNDAPNQANEQSGGGFVPDPKTFKGGMDVFTCPEINNGGLPPQSTSPDNLDPGQTSEVPGNVDFQAPRLAYTANAAIIPNGKWLVGFQGKTVNPYHLIKASVVDHSAETVLVTEWLDNSKVVTDAGRLNSSVNTCKSNRPTNGVVVLNGGSPVANPSAENFSPPSATYRPATAADLLLNRLGVPPSQVSSNDIAINISKSITRLDWIGRNHGKGGFAKAKTNFLYVDGHVETKALEETLSPYQWGSRFWTLTKH